MDNQTYYDYLVKRSRFSLLFRNKLFIQSLTRCFSGRVLDVGCGIGEFLEAYPGEVIGVDINPLLVKYCQGKGFDGTVAGAYGLPFASESFDGVLIYHVLEHLPDVETAVAEALRVLKPGGTLVFAVPMAAGFRHDDTHIHLIQKEDVQALAQKFNLTPRMIAPWPKGSGWLSGYLYICELRSVLQKATE